MADKSFGVKELNLISASGTPTITSPNSVNINATNVAISTDITVGGMVSLGAGTSISSPGSNILTFGTNSTEKVRITSDGDLLLGTTSNAGGNRLYVVDNFTDTFVNPSDSVLRVENANTSGTATQASISLTSKTSGSNADSAIVSQAEDASGNASLQFWTDTSNGMSEKLRITSAGDIGVGGITSPSFTTGGGIHLKRNYGIGFGDGSNGRPDFQLVTTAGSTLDFRCGLVQILLIFQ